jgi:hypothetical protein
LKPDANRVPARGISLSFNHDVEEDPEATNSSKYRSTDIKKEKTVELRGPHAVQLSDDGAT